MALNRKCHLARPAFPVRRRRQLSSSSIHSVARRNGQTSGFETKTSWPMHACMHLHLVVCSLNLLKILSFHSAHQLQPNPLHQLTYSSTYNKSNAIYSTLSVVYFRYLAEKVLMYHHVNVYPIPRHKSRGWQTFTTCSRSTAQKQKLMLWYGHQH